LGTGADRDGYAHAFGLAQAVITIALLLAMLLSIPRRRRVRMLDRSPSPG
jgi:hypothetical protein